MRISGITYVPRKTHRIRNSIAALLVFFLICAAVIVLISAYTGWKLIHPQKEGIEPFSSNIVPEYRDISFNSINDNTVLNGWFFEAKGSTKTVILAHGYAKNRLQFQEQTLDIIKGFLSAGYNVLAFDFRNSGKSGGKMTTLGFHEKNDLLGAVNFVKLLGAKHIVLMGFSTGASASIMAAAENNDIDAVIADSPYLELRKHLSNRIPKLSRLPAFPFNAPIMLSVELIAGMDIDRVNPGKSIVNITPRPVLLIHSKNDDVIPVEDSRTLYSIISFDKSSRSGYWETDGEGHLGSFTSYPREYMEKVLSFLEKEYAG